MASSRTLMAIRELAFESYGDHGTADDDEVDEVDDVGDPVRDDDGTARAENANGESRCRDAPTAMMMMMMMMKKKQAGSCSAATGRTYLCCF